MKYLTKLLIPFLLTASSVISLQAQNSDIVCGDTKMTYSINAGTYGDVKVESSSSYCRHIYQGAIKPGEQITVKLSTLACVPGVPGDHINTIDASVIFIDNDGSKLPGKNVHGESAYGSCPSVEVISVKVPKKAKAAIVNAVYKSPYYVWDQGWSNQICEVSATYAIGDNASVADIPEIIPSNEEETGDSEVITETDETEGISFGDVDDEESEGFKIETWMIIAAGGLLLVVIVLVIVLAVSKKNKNRKKAQVPPQQPVNPYWQPPVYNQPAPVPPVPQQPEANPLEQTVYNPAPGQFAPPQPAPGAPVQPAPPQPEGNPLEQTVYVPQGPDPQNPQ